MINPNTQNLTKSYRDYLQNTQHVVLRNRPTLSISMERLACSNNSRGVWLGTLAWHVLSPGFDPQSLRARCGRFFLHPPFLPPSGELFLHLPHYPHENVTVKVS